MNITLFLYLIVTILSLSIGAYILFKYTKRIRHLQDNINYADLICNYQIKTINVNHFIQTQYRDIQKYRFIRFSLILCLISVSLIIYIISSIIIHI